MPRLFFARSSSVITRFFLSESEWEKSDDPDAGQHTIVGLMV
jgi:hypothetical protein